MSIQTSRKVIIFIPTVLLLVFSMILISCSKEVISNFQISGTVFKKAEPISFINTSQNADHYFWDFGDNETSIGESPKHSYFESGLYEITLTAYSKGERNSDDNSQLVEISDSSTMSFPCPGIDSIEDNDGNWYPTVQIGEQCWMAKNLKTGIKVNSLNQILGEDSLNTQTDNGVIEKYCYWNMNEYCDSLGGLYKWDELLNYYDFNNGMKNPIRGICPQGWHIPNSDEWQILVDYNGGNDIAGKRLKKVGNLFWTYMNSDATNESGFSAYGGGLRSEIGTFNAIKSSGIWWTYSQAIGNPTQVLMLHNSNSVFFGNVPDNNGYSVRCIKD